MIKFRIRIVVPTYGCMDEKGCYFLSPHTGVTKERKDAYSYTYLPSTFDKQRHVLELVL